MTVTANTNMGRFVMVHTLIAEFVLEANFPQLKKMLFCPTVNAQLI